MKIQEKPNNFELLSPAGNIEKMKTALIHGADAVYAGIPDFSLRVRINDFDLEKIKMAVYYCHSHGKKIYITVNIFAHNHHIEKLPAYIKKLKEFQVDALIVSDPGVIHTIKSVWPEAVIHLSTQMNCTNHESARFWYEQGIERIILGREVSLEEISEIKKRVPKLELEYFVHGAMCMAYSGRCFLSKYYLDRSANLGDCVQPCRWPFFAKATKGKNFDVKSIAIQADSERVDTENEFEMVEGQHGSYILNSKDLRLLKHLGDLADAGVTSFKIEGRAKSLYYQAMIAGIYSRVLKNLGNIQKKEINFLNQELEEKLVHRGYTTGFLLGDKADQNLQVSHNKSNWEFCGQVVTFPRKGHTTNVAYSNKKVDNSNILFVKVHNSIKIGDEIEIVRPRYDIIKMRIGVLQDAESGEEIKEAHGGQGKIVAIQTKEKIPEYSVLRRRI